MTFLLIVFSVILLFWVIVRVFLMRIFSKSRDIRSQQERENGRRGNDGDVYVSKDETDDDKKMVEKDMGEYVDFEPVKEDKPDGDI